MINTLFINGLCQEKDKKTNRKTRSRQSFLIRRMKAHSRA